MSKTEDPGHLARRELLRAGGRVAGLVVLFAAGSRASAADATEVHIDNFKFAPNVLTVPKGATITWVNRDDIPHSVVVPSLGFHSHPMDTDGTTTFTFNQPGHYDYLCGLHPFMKGQVIVQG